MKTADDYIDRNGKVDREGMADDVKARIIKGPDIERIVSDKRIQAGFINGTFKRAAKKEWDKDYLDKLSYTAISECFNMDYLLYLDEVADFVSKARFKKVDLRKAILVLVIIAGVVVLIYWVKKSKKELTPTITAPISDTTLPVVEPLKAQEDGMEPYEMK